MEKVIHRVRPTHLLAFWGACLMALGIYLPSVLTRFPIYMGMLIGYLQAKTQFLLWFGSNIGELIVGSYLSLRYRFGLSSTNHDGVNILLSNAVYFAIITTIVYVFFKRDGKSSVAKTIVISGFIAGILMIVVGMTVLMYNPKIRFQMLSNQPSVEYVVQAGDTCEQIAFEYSVSVESIVKTNRLPYTCMLMAGQTIEIPLH